MVLTAKQRIAGMITAPRYTLRQIIRGQCGDFLEPLALYALVTLLIAGRAVYKTMWMIGDAPLVTLNRLETTVLYNGRSDFLLLLFGAALFSVYWFLQKFVAKKTREEIDFTPYSAFTALSYLLIPLLVMKSIGAILSYADFDLWWMPHYPVDSFVVSNRGQIMWDRYIFKFVVAYLPSILLFLDLFLSLLRRDQQSNINNNTQDNINNNTQDHTQNNTQNHNTNKTIDAGLLQPSKLKYTLGTIIVAMPLALLGIGSAVDVYNVADKLKPTIGGDVLPEVSLPWLSTPQHTQINQQPVNNDTDISLQKLGQGRVMVLDFWASWCGPCRRSVPELSQLSDGLKAKGQDVLFLGINREPQDLASAQDAWKRLAPNFDSLVDNKKLAERLGVESLPTSYIVDKKGTIRHIHIGHTDPSVFQKEIAALLAESPAE